MLYLDYVAYNNKLVRVSIQEKLLLGGGCLLLALFFPQPQVLSAIILLMHMIMLGAGVPVRFLLHLWLAPLGFVLLSLVSIVLDWGSQPWADQANIKIAHYYIWLAPHGLSVASKLFMRCAAGTSCLFMIATTTPIVHIAAFMARLRWLHSSMEIVLLTYRFIFILLETAGRMLDAQQSRLGYANRRQSLQSFAALTANLGGKSLNRASQLSIALQARNYQGRLFAYLPSQVPKWWRVVLIIGLLAGIFFITRL
ncbi:cobalt ECF transporter T component CbiQ [Sporomusaceae bacterium FL31]|nr:cobalt ECF transporter T component CbiQ [Sporomusaceae bacterium FL31]GCE34239.1 cobalt ECF transporter T component CbiQ [Sporomusaceae bacterium]